jgi:hypothetical protein
VVFYLLLGFLAFAAIGWLKRNRLLRLPTWRLGAGALSIAVFAAALYCGVRNMWVPAVVLGVVGAWAAVSARHPRVQTRGPNPPSRTMTLAEARSILGVGETATPAEIKAAYTRLMQRVHPDAGGAAGLATQLNLARDRLLKT